MVVEIAEKWKRIVVRRPLTWPASFLAHFRFSLRSEVSEEPAGELGA